MQSLAAKPRVQSLAVARDRQTCGSCLGLDVSPSSLLCKVAPHPEFWVGVTSCACHSAARDQETLVKVVDKWLLSLCLGVTQPRVGVLVWHPSEPQEQRAE